MQEYRPGEGIIFRKLFIDHETANAFRVKLGDEGIAVAARAAQGKEDGTGGEQQFTAVEQDMRCLHIGGRPGRPCLYYGCYLRCFIQAVELISLI